MCLLGGLEQASSASQRAKFNEMPKKLSGGGAGVEGTPQQQFGVRLRNASCYTGERRELLGGDSSSVPGKVLTFDTCSSCMWDQNPYARRQDMHT